MPATEKYLRNIKRTHVVFCVASMALTLATFTMLLVDHKDEWRVWQGRFSRIEVALNQKDELAAFDAAGGQREYEKKRDDLQKQKSDLSSELAEQDATFKTLSDEVGRLALEYDLIFRNVRDQRAQRDVARANYDLGVRDELSEYAIAPKKKRFDDLEVVVRDLELQAERKNEELSSKQKELNHITAKRDDVEKQLKAFTAEVTRIDDVLSAINPSGVKKVKRRLMELPIIDGFNSHQRVVQDWLPDLRITLGMAKPARFDRCRTCHLGIDRFGAGDVPVFPHGHDVGQYPHPFSSHPRPDIYLTATSPHPLPSFGCTICHDGQGSATSFVNAQHGPNDPHQEEEWHKEYGHFHNHFWEYPMHSARLLESGCIKCHHEVIELGVNPKFGASAPKAHRGWELIRKFGCFGCHEINGFDGKRQIGPDLRLEPNEEELAKYAADPNMIPGQLRKVGPSLKHVSQKVSAEFIAYWTEEPKRFRPSTKMPQFFGVSNFQEDPHGQALSKIELASIAHYLEKQSTPVELDPLPAGYKPNAERGKELFGQRGCLACHTYQDDAFKGVNADFGPDLTGVGKKLRPGIDGFNWLYTWIRDPQRHHPRSKMPNLYLDPQYDEKGQVTVDPAADIAEFLSAGERGKYSIPEYTAESVRELAQMYLLGGKALTADQFDEFWKSRKYPGAKESLKGDEVELAGDAPSDDAEWSRRLLSYLGRRSLSRYGCYGCHDINGYGTSRPIGTSLQDWGRKDPSRLAPEHIHEYLHHHGQPDGSSTQEYVEDVLKTAASDSFSSDEEKDAGLRTAFFYESLIHHGRPGFIFQKLRDPRSYDYRKIETKKYVERLVMPKFPLKDDEIEAIATFVLGLVADPPAPKYLYSPTQEVRDRNRGEILMRTFNCIGCHVTDLDRIEYAVEEGDLAATPDDPSHHQFGRDALLALRPPVPGYTGHTHKAGDKDLPTVSLRGMIQMTPDPEEEDPEARQYTFTTWEPVQLNEPGGKDGGILLPSLQVIPETRVAKVSPAQTGMFASWLVQQKMRNGFDPKAFDTGWQSGPPPLFREGDKVQNNWLYQFIKDPKQIRHTIVLRMPRFNLSNDEARALANYFSATDGVTYPYQSSDETVDDYLARAEARFRVRHPDRASNSDAKGGETYLDESWRMLTTTLCTKCHAVGGREFKSVPNDPNVTRGPNLETVARRLRSEWLTVWVSNPKWLTPYTAMPLPFGANQKQYAPLFDQDPGDQTIGVRDALLNYYYLLERHTTPLPIAN